MGIDYFDDDFSDYFFDDYIMPELNEGGGEEGTIKKVSFSAYSKLSEKEKLDFLYY